MHNEARIFNLTELGLLRISSGEQAKKFLQGQLTCNLEEITTSQSRLSAHCNPQGRIISLFQIFMYADNYYLQMPRSLIPIAKQTLQKYAVFFKVTLTDTSDELSQLGYIGDELPSMPQTIHEQVSMDKYIVIRLPGIPARYLFIGETSTLHNKFKTGLSEFNDWKSMDIANYIAAIYPATSEKFLPHDLDLPTLKAVSFNKGCYTGQEIIARMQYRGKLKNHLYRARINTPFTLQHGADIYAEGKSCGNLVDFCQTDDDNYTLLIVTQDHNKPMTIDPEEKYSLEFLT